MIVKLRPEKRWGNTCDRIRFRPKNYTFEFASLQNLFENCNEHRSII